MWTQVGPDTLGGRTRALAIDVNDGNTLIAGAVSGGIWKSTDGGASWTQTLTPTQLLSVTTIAQDTRTGNTNTWYAGTGEYTGNSASGDRGVLTLAMASINQPTTETPGLSWSALPPASHSRSTT